MSTIQSPSFDPNLDWSAITDIKPDGPAYGVWGGGGPISTDLSNTLETEKPSTNSKATLEELHTTAKTDTKFKEIVDAGMKAAVSIGKGFVVTGEVLSSIGKKFAVAVLALIGGAIVVGAVLSVGAIALGIWAAKTILSGLASVLGETAQKKMETLFNKLGAVTAVCTAIALVLPLAIAAGCLKGAYELSQEPGDHTLTQRAQNYLQEQLAEVKSDVEKKCKEFVQETLKQADAFVADATPKLAEMAQATAAKAQDLKALVSQGMSQAHLLGSTQLKEITTPSVSSSGGPSADKPISPVPGPGLGPGPGLRPEDPD